ncbi:MAG: cytochrome b/b6 domain-containing protein [Aquabacterium sp.]|nr:cytochrome b/b6 domain-containing protein [Aquabacterium sp.]
MTSDVKHPPVRVWDLQTRAFHWLLATAVIGLVITAKVGGNAMIWHMRLGLVVLALLSFRIVWGLVGGRWSRFASFTYAPGTVWRYLRGDHRPGDHFEVGHSPLGAFSVFALIALLLVQVGTGLIADDEIATIGPLNRYVATATGIAATGWHKGYGQWILLGLIGLHIVAIAVYKLRGKNLVTPMITGDKPLPASVPATQDSLANRGLAAVLLLACAALAVWIARLGT